MKHRIGLIGCGTVGQGLLEILDRKKDSLRDEHGFEAKVVGITDKIRGTLVMPKGIDIPTVLEVLGRGGNLSEYPKATAAQTAPLDPVDMIAKIDADIIAELTYTDIKTGEPATSYIRKALDRAGPPLVHTVRGSGFVLRERP